MSQSNSFFDVGFVAGLQRSSNDRKHEILKIFWPGRATHFSSLDQASYASLFQYVGKELGQIRHHQRHFAAHDFEGSGHIVRVLQKNLKTPKTQVLDSLATHFLNAEPAALQRSLELSVRLWLTVNINSATVAVGPTFADEAPLDWEPDVSLQELVESQFSKSIHHTAKGRRAQIDPTLTAAYLVNSCGMTIRWTDSISDHLRFDTTHHTLSVYRHKICLANHLDTTDGCPIPKGVLGEILDTLNLLFPFGDVATKQLLIKEHQQPLYRLGSCGRPRKLEINQYEYFREELEYLIESFNQPPRTWKQLAMDRRNKLEWAAFWVTVMVAVLTFVSIPCNLIQATYSVKAYRATVAQMKSM
ncbi:hypothetical protein DM02DRAFT_732939 [Periconia macrospinosa]|uniref:Uncharacterized protein n=1 Tax=Periconia macrospinosa TaxID=97972 RepID=A0A2V1D6M6_9PLEO|nr:hypothetical protein DM02DRAFT_732939 [Periconia macrospinosa]